MEKKPNYLQIAFVSYLTSSVIYFFMPRKLLGIHWDPGSLHVHHFTYGILILAIGYLVALNAQKIRTKLLLAVFYGFGLFLIIDEIQLWLFLAPSMDDHAPLRHLPGVITVVVFLLLLLIQKIRKNKIPR